MNKRNVKKLRDFIAKLPEENFDMWLWVWMDRNEETVEEARTHSCGTVCCLAGWAALLASDPTAKLAGSIPFVNGVHVSRIAERWLKLAPDEAARLFDGDWSTRRPSRNVMGLMKSNQQKAAVKELDHLLKTGEV